jgi:hypothetical protein
VRELVVPALLDELRLRGVEDDLPTHLGFDVPRVGEARGGDADEDEVSTYVEVLEER